MEYATEDDATRTTMPTPLPGVQSMVDAIMASGNTAAGPNGIPFGAYRLFADLAGPVLHDVLVELADGQPPPKGLQLRVSLPAAQEAHYAHPGHEAYLGHQLRQQDSGEMHGGRDHRPSQASPSHRAEGLDSRLQGQDHIKELTEKFCTAVESPTEQYHVLFADTKKAFDSIHTPPLHFLRGRPPAEHQQAGQSANQAGPGFLPCSYCYHADDDDLGGSTTCRPLQS